MKRDAYLADTEVRAFLRWSRPFATGERSLTHAWTARRGAFHCQSLFEAYREFDWPFRVQIPGESSPRRGRSREENFAVLDRLSILLRQAADGGNARAFLTAVTAVVEWGGAGVQQNRVRLTTLGAEALTVVREDAVRLDPARADLGQLDEVGYLNAGFSKIQALLLDDFPMYDSRVACALASMVRRYCEENGRATVPRQLALSIPPPQGPIVRNPSAGTLRFRGMRWRDTKQYASSNVIAAWLLAALATHGPFGDLPPDRRLPALQSAMFMLGYRPIEDDAWSRADRAVSPSPSHGLGALVP